MEVFWLESLLLLWFLFQFGGPAGSQMDHFPGLDACTAPLSSSHLQAAPIVTIPFLTHPFLDLQSRS